MGRLLTTMATKVSRQAQRLPLTAPSGPDCEGLVLAKGCAEFQGVGGTYGQDRDGTDGSRKDDEHGAAEQQHQCQSTPERGVYAPEKLLDVSKNVFLPLTSLQEKRTGRGIDSR